MAEHVPLVAIVDDEEPIRKALKRLMRAANLEAEAFASAPNSSTRSPSGGPTASSSTSTCRE